MSAFACMAFKTSYHVYEKELFDEVYETIESTQSIEIWAGRNMLEEFWMNIEATILGNPTVVPNCFQYR